MECFDYQSKIIIDFNILGEEIEALKKIGKKIVLTSGTYDLMHIGHCRYLQKAKNCLENPENTILIVGLDSDAKVKKQKGPNRPIVPEEERMEMLSHIRHVDIVFLKQPEEEKWKLIKFVKPDVLILSARTEYSKPEQKELETYCKEVKELESQAETSTSAKIRLITIETAQEMEKLFEGFSFSISELLFNFRHNVKNKVERMQK